jgi:hypothetical protein
MTDEANAQAARDIIDANRYLVLASADASGLPWATPVYYAQSGYREFVWVSRPGAQHSENLARRGDVGIVIFDSTVPIGTGQGVYLRAVAAEVVGDECAPALEFFSQRSLTHGGRVWTVADVQPPAQLRLYRATALEHYLLDEHDHRIPVTP